MTAEPRTLRLRCCCGRKRTFHIRADLDPAAGEHLVDRVLACPYADCHRRCRARVPASALASANICRGQGEGEGDAAAIPPDPLIDRTLETEEEA
jgi:hypothetical protein